MDRVAKKDARFGMRLELMFIVWSKKWETSAAKGSKIKQVRFRLEQNFPRRFVTK